MATRDALAAVEAEILEERAASLGRIARVLEADLDELARLRRLHDTASDGERARLRAAYAERRRHAEKYRFYLSVQWEAIGLRDQRLLERFYVIPPPLG